MSPEYQYSGNQSVALDKPTSGDEEKQLRVGILKSIISTIPFVGTALNEALFDIRSRIQQDRTNALVQELANGMKTLTAQRIDREFMATEEFSDIISDVFIRNSRISSADKRERFARIILGSISGRRGESFDHVFRHLVEELTEDDIDILAQFTPAYSQSYDANLPEDWAEPLVSVLDYEQEQVLGRPPVVTKMIIQNLIRVGLLFDDSHGRLSTSPYTVVMPTDLGAAFYDWLQAMPEISP